MSKCKICGMKINKGYDNYRNCAIRIPFFNIVVWRYNFEHLSCLEKEKNDKI